MAAASVSCKLMNNSFMEIEYEAFNFIFASLAASAATPAFGDYIYNTLASFDGDNGMYRPHNDMTFDAAGDLLGTTYGNSQGAILKCLRALTR